jgi:hypothetical protein
MAVWSVLQIGIVFRHVTDFMTCTVLNLCCPGVMILSLLVLNSLESYAIVTVSVLKKAYFASPNSTI